MVTTCHDIIKRGLRKIGALASGDDIPASEAQEALAALQSIIMECVGIGTFGRLSDVRVTADYTAREWDRIFPTTGVTITLPTVISNRENCPTVYNAGAWFQLNSCCGYWDYGFPYQTGERPPRDRSVVVVVDTFAYCAEKTGWFQISGLALETPWPLASYLEDGFAALLAERMADEYGQVLGAGSVRAAAQCRMMLSHKYDSSGAPVVAEYF